MEDIFASRTRDEWQLTLSQLDACCEPVLELDEVPAHPQIVARGVLHAMREGHAPGLGEHTQEVLAEVGVDAAALEELQKAGAA